MTASSSSLALPCEMWLAALIELLMPRRWKRREPVTEDSILIPGF